MSGTVERLWIKRAHRGPMDPVDQFEANPRQGIVGDANRGRRQVTIIEREVWERLMEETGGDADPSARRANVLVTGVPLPDRRGQILRLGPVRVRILGETKPCERMEDAVLGLRHVPGAERMDEAVPGLRRAMYRDWGGGAFGKIIEGGLVTVGDRACWEAESAETRAPSISYEG